MEIFGIMLVKNEKDIIRFCLEDSLRWIDKMFILDNGSTDGTWEILQDMESERIVLWKQDFSPYRRSMRRDLFMHFRDEAQDGDWWYHADADEFAVDDPRAFLEAVPSKYQVVFKKSIDYQITKEDVGEYEFSNDFSIDRQFLNYINPGCWTEIRFFKYRKGLEWSPLHDRPNRLGRWYPNPVIMKHYQYRSPGQMQERLDIRNQIPKDREERAFEHIKETSWRELLKSRDELVLDEGYEQYVKLPLRRKIREVWYKKIIQAILYRTGIIYKENNR